MSYVLYWVKGIYHLKKTELYYQVVIQLVLQYLVNHIPTSHTLDWSCSDSTFIDA